jgi:hypothetical protein
LLVYQLMDVWGGATDMGTWTGRSKSWENR